MSDPETAEFDRHARDYDAQLRRGLAFTGEPKEYFAERRIAWLLPLLSRHGVVPRQVLDYGCGTGTALPLLLELPGAERVLGVDVSRRSLDEAGKLVGTDARICLATPDEAPEILPPCDLVYSSAVFHHIPPPQRPAALAYIQRALRPGGLLALWEHNPWNPGTQFIVHRVPLDRDAILLRPRQASRLIQDAGLVILETCFLFLFPRSLASLRFLETPLARWPLGAQYLVLARRP